MALTQAQVQGIQGADLPTKVALKQVVADIAAAATGTAATVSTAGVVKQGVHVAPAAGANPTAAEYLALLTSLQNAGILASS